jgi:hypothetical protein
MTDLVTGLIEMMLVASLMALGVLLLVWIVLPGRRRRR